MSSFHAREETRMKTKLIAGVFGVLLLAVGCFAQSGGIFVITDSVVGPSGGSSSEDIFDVQGTAGQGVAGGPIGGDQFSVTSGFWNFTALAPTAAHVSISGRVTDVEGIGLQQASVSLRTQDGESMFTRTSTFGYYRFEGVAIGQSVFITVNHKRFIFEPRAIMVVDEIAGLDFVAVK
jgi:hypothetical protein